MSDPKGGGGWGDAVAELIEQLRHNERFKKTLGENMSKFILATLVIAAAEFTYGLPIVTMATAPVAGAILVYLLDSVQVWINSGKPDYVFFVCGHQGCARFAEYFIVAWDEMPRYRKRKRCGFCGEPLIKKCPTGKHFIVSPFIGVAGTQPPPPGRHDHCADCGRPYIP